MILLRFGFRNFFVVVDGVVLYIKCICLYLCGEKKNAGENLQGEVYRTGVCHEKAQEIGDAPKRPGRHVLYQTLM